MISTDALQGGFLSPPIFVNDLNEGSLLMIVNGGPSLKIVYKTTSVIKMILKNDCFQN